MAVAFPIAAGQKLTSAVMNHQYSITDTATTTVTAAVATNLSTVYVIPANDAAVGMAYRLSCGGDGTWGSTQRTLTFAAALAGTSVGFQATINSTALSASAAFRWKIMIMLIPVTTGGSATFHTSIEGCVTESANNILPGTAADNTVPIGGHSLAATAGDSTIANNFAVQAAWGGTTATITNRSTVFERLG